jgi:hypothetical protein
MITCYDELTHFEYVSNLLEEEEPEAILA